MSSEAQISKPLLNPERVVLRDGREVLIRSGEPDDAPALLGYMHRCLPDNSPYIAMDPHEFTMTEASERVWLKQQSDTLGAMTVVAFEGERMVGITNCSCRSDRCRIAHIGHVGMSADKAYWGSGLGGAMLSGLIGWAERHPILEILELDVFADNSRALALYRRLGFIEVGRVPGRGRFADGSRTDGILMYRPVLQGGAR